MTTADQQKKALTRITTLNPEVAQKAIQRRFTGAYKLLILKEVDALSDSGQMGALWGR